jgi:hypothetical protein
MVRRRKLKEGAKFFSADPLFFGVKSPEKVQLF